MAKNKNKKKQKPKQKSKFTPIDKHKFSGSVLTTQLTDSNMSIVDWERDLMPEHIWIDLLANEYKQLNWLKIYNDFADKIDASLEKDHKTPFLGLISDFGMLSDSERSNFLSSNKDFAFRAFFKPVGKILSLYPNNPANWLILDDWKNIEKIDFELELNRLAKSLYRLVEAKDLYAGNIRTIPLTRLFKHKKIFHPVSKSDELIKLLIKYPGGCSEKEKYRVQQHARIIINMTIMKSDRYKNNKWPKYFWRHNYDLAPCKPMSGSITEGDFSDEDDIRNLQISLWENCVILMKYLDKIGMQYKYDLYNPLFDEIKLGLFSRIIRLYISFVSIPFLWTRDLSGIMLRCIGETAIIYFYLVKKGSEEELLKFQEYSLGKEKLLMLHMQDTLKEKATLEGKSMDDISDEIGGDFIAELQKIELKNWTKKNIRELSKEVDLDNIYRWVIDPSSAEIHGSWNSLRKSNLVICQQILHRFHRIPKFYEPPIFIIPIYVATEIYTMCENLAVDELGCPFPDEKIKEIPKITEAYQKIFKNETVTS